LRSYTSRVGQLISHAGTEVKLSQEKAIQPCIANGESSRFNHRSKRLAPACVVQEHLPLPQRREMLPCIRDVEVLGRFPDVAHYGYLFFSNPVQRLIWTSGAPAQILAVVRRFYNKGFCVGKIGR